MFADDTRSAGRREWTGLAVLALPTLLLALDMSVLYLALPRLSSDLGAGATQQLWIMDIYGFMIAGLLITMGNLGDRIGRRRLLLIGAGAFGAASVLAAYSTSPEVLIATRALLGIAGATLMPSTMALITNMFRDPKQRAVAFAVWISCFMGGTAIGPVVGGVMLENFWWGSAFLLGVPVMALLLVTGPRLLPEYRNPETGRVDLASVALSIGAILPAIYGMKEIAKHGIQPLPVLAIAAGVAAGVLFVRRQRRLASPLLDLRLFGNRAFRSALGIFLLVGAAMGGIYLFVTQYLQLVEGMSPLQAGLWLLPPVIAMIVVSMLTSAAARRVRPAYLMGTGLAVAAVGLVLLTQVDSGVGRAFVVAAFVITIVGIAPATALGTDLIVGSVPPERAGSAASMSETSGELGIALGLAVLGSVGTAAYRAGLTVPAGVPAEVAGSARESIAVAGVAAEQLPAPLAAELLDSAREAFTSGLHAVAAVAAVLFVLLAVVAVVALRHVPAYGQRVPEPVDATATPEADDDRRHEATPALAGHPA